MPRASAASLFSRSTRRTTSASTTGPSVAGSNARVWWYLSRSSISFCSDSVFSRTMRTMSRCSRDELAADLVAQQLGALAHRGERRLELVRDVAQEAVLLLLELGEPHAQPFEPLPEVAQVLRAVDVHGLREVGGAHLPDRLVELADRARDQHREHERERDRDADGRERQPQPLLAALRRRLLQAARSRACVTRSTR